ncbi:MAG: CopG family transcriptional regulator [Spartobacteria bacterium]|nr:CopG family transcriptional regulator [Spartobacteria bacterium]
MSKTVTLRLDESVYGMFCNWAKRDNRPLSNFIETAVLRFIEEHEIVDEFEMAEITANSALNKSIKLGLKDAKAKRGSFV